MNTKICFDMDGTIADLYGVENWLYALENSMTLPYEQAKPLVRLSSFAKRINHIQRMGYKIAIISWTSKSGDENYHNAVVEAKMNWLAKHLPSVQWDEINIVPYGTPKESFCETGYCNILFDDEQRNRDNWTGMAFDEIEMATILENIAKNDFLFRIECLRQALTNQ